MAIYRIRKTFSFFNKKNRSMVDILSNRLDEERIFDYDVSGKIPNDVPSITTKNLDEIKIYLPLDYEYSVFVIDNQVRSLSPGLRTFSRRERDLYVLTVNSRLTEDQLFELVKSIIRSEEFITLLDL